jgi:hypothetical protein
VFSTWLDPKIDGVSVRRAVQTVIDWLRLKQSVVRLAGYRRDCDPTVKLDGQISACGFAYSA